MKSIKEAKSRLVVGARLLCVRNTYRPELNGTYRVATSVGAKVWQWKGEYKTQDAKPSHSAWPSGISIIDADTFRLPLWEKDYVELRFVPAADADQKYPFARVTTPGGNCATLGMDDAGKAIAAKLIKFDDLVEQENSLEYLYSLMPGHSLAELSSFATAD